MNTSQDSQQCVICNKRPAVTRDHIPPKGIFIKPRPDNLICVPSCHECNLGSSGLDERFRVYLGLHAAGAGGQGEEFFKQEALKTLDHNRKLRREILSKLEPTYLQTEGGIIYGKAYRIAWDSKAHDAIVERIIRGLYYHHYNEILGDLVNIKVHWFRKLTRKMVEMSEEWNVNSFGKGEVTYRFDRATEQPLHSVWIFQFYKAHWAGGYTTPKKHKDDALQGQRQAKS
jgi:hypothetical protein